MATTRSFNYLSLILGLGGLVVGLGLGLFLAKMQPVNQAMTPLQMTDENKSSMNDDVFSTQNATANGRVSAATDKSVTITTTKGTSTTFNLNQPFYLIDGNSAGKPISDGKSIPNGQQVILNLQKNNGQFQVMSVNVLRPSSPPPVPSGLPVTTLPAQK